MDIALWMEAIDPIVEALGKADPAGKEEYVQNVKRVQQEMQIMHEKISNLFAAVPPERRYLVTSHAAFGYFVRSYLSSEEDFKQRSAAPEGLAPDGQLSSTDIQQVISYLMEKDIHVIFAESNVSRDILKKLCSVSREKGHAMEIAPDVLYSDAMGPAGSSADSYLKMMEHNAETLLKAWR